MPLIASTASTAQANRVGFIRKLLTAVVLMAVSVFSHAQLKGLYLTSPGVYHDYAYQSEALTAAIAGQIDIQFEVSLAESERWKNTDFAEGFDVLVYNICMADNSDAELIANLRRQTTLLGVPTIVVHCTMHSFRNTDQWWPLHGLKTVRHEALGEMTLEQTTTHPILEGIRKDWTLEEDELYVNITFEGSALLTSPGEDGKDHATAWVHDSNGTRIFGTSLGHSNKTISDPQFHRLLGNAVRWVTQSPAQAHSPRKATSQSAIHTISRAPGVDFYTEAHRSCMQWEMGKAVGPCLTGCTLHPLKWGAEADQCREACLEELPTQDEMAAACVE